MSAFDFWLTHQSTLLMRNFVLCLLIFIWCTASLFASPLDDLTHRPTNPPATMAGRRGPVKSPGKRRPLPFVVNKLPIKPLDLSKVSRPTHWQYVESKIPGSDTTGKLVPVSPLFNGVQIAGPDPIRFMMQTNKQVVGAGEDFELLIEAHFLDISPNSMFFLEEQKSFRLKMLLPEKFIQVSGSYFDGISAALSSSQPDFYCKIVGHFIEEPQNLNDHCFTLLRTNYTPTNNDLFTNKGTICFQGDPKNRLFKRKAQISSNSGATTNGGVTNNVVVENEHINESKPFCTNENIVYAANYGNNVYAEKGPNYKCLRAQPNPAWFHLKGYKNGNITIRMTGKSSNNLGRDVDYIGWGPYDSLEDSRNLNNLDTTHIVGCSFDPSSVESVTFTILKDKYYIFLVTNYSNDESTISFAKVNGDGETDCGIVNIPTPILSSASPTACGQTGNYTPLTVSGCNSGQIRFHTVNSNGPYDWTVVAPSNGSYTWDYYGGVQEGTYTANCLINGQEGNSSNEVHITSNCCSFDVGITDNKNYYVNCNQSQAISLDCGGDCSPYTATWTGPASFSHTGTSVTLPGSNVTGTVNYILNLTKAGCSDTKQITIHLNTSCTTTDPCSSIALDAPVVSGELGFCSGNSTLLTVSCPTIGSVSDWTNNQKRIDRADTYTVTCSKDNCSKSTTVTIYQKGVTECSDCTVKITNLSDGESFTQSCGSSITISPVCDISDCSSLTAVWRKVSTSEVVSNELTLTTNAPSTEGHDDYLLTIGKKNCSEFKQFTIHLYSSGCTAPDLCANSNLTAPTVTGERAICLTGVTVLTATCQHGDPSWPNGVLSVTATGTYYVSCGQDGCNKSTTVDITRKPDSQCGSTPTSNCVKADGVPYPTDQETKGPSEEVCIGDVFSLTADKCNPVEATIKWPDGRTTTTINLTAPATNTTYSFTCTYPSGCQRVSSPYTLYVKNCQTDLCIGHTDPIWENRGTPFCDNGAEYQKQEDTNPCSSRNPQFRNEPTGNDSRCRTPQAPILPNRTGTVGQSLSVTLSGFTDPNGQALAYQINNLPAGLSANGLTITGTPTTQETRTVTVVATNTGGLSASATFIFTINSAPSNTGFALVDPLFNCTSHQFTFQTTGGNAATIRYRSVPGITGWTTNPGSYTLDIHNDTPPFTLEACQGCDANGNGGTYVSRVWDAKAFCNNLPQSPPQAPPLPNRTGTVGQSLSILLPGFTDPNGQALAYQINNLPAGLSANGLTIMGTPTTQETRTVTVVATNTGGLSASATFIFTINSAPSNTGFALVDPLFNCTSHQFTFQTTGGNAATIRYRSVPGITDWTTNPGTYTLDIHNDTPPFTLEACQGCDANGNGGTYVSRVWDAKAFCNKPPRPTVNNVSVCQGQNATLSASGCAGQILWSTNQTFTSIVIPATSLTAPVTSFSAVCQVNGYTSDPAVATVTVNPLPSATAYSRIYDQGFGIPPTQTVCEGGNMAFGRDHFDFQIYKVQWKKPDGSLREPANEDWGINNITPAQAGNYTYIVTDLRTGCTNSAIVAVTINPKPASPTPVTYNNGSTNSFSVGTAVKLETVCLTGTPSWTYTSGPVPGIGNTSSESSITQGNNPQYVAGTYQYAVQCTDATCKSDVVNATVVLLALPGQPTSLLFNGSSTPAVCEGTRMEFTSSCPTGTVHWTRYNVPGGTKIGEATGNSLLFEENSGTGPYYYSVECLNTSTGSFGPALTFTFTLDARPTGPFLAGSNSPAGQARPGDPISLTATAIPGATYQWKGPNTFAATGQNPASFSASASASGPYSVTATRGACQLSATTSVSVTPNQFIGAFDGIYCTTVNGWLVDLKQDDRRQMVKIVIDNDVYLVETNIPRPDVRDHIYRNFGISGSFNLFGFSWTIPAKYRGTNKTIKVSTIDGIVFGTATLDLTPTSVTLTPANAQVCAGQTVTLTAQATGGAGHAYVFSGGSSSGNQTIVNASNIYSVTATAASGCTATATANVEITQPPVPVISSSRSTLCGSGSVTLNATGCPGWVVWVDQANPSVFLEVSKSTPYTFTVTPSVTTTYRAFCSVSACNSPLSDPVIVNVNAQPTASISANPNLILCPGQSITLLASGGNGDQWKWSNNATTSSISVSATGTYSVTVSNGTGCSAVATATVTTGTPLTASIVGSLSFCAGQSTTLTAGGGTAYRWSDLASTTTPTLTVNTAGPYSVTVSNGSGCSSTTTVTVGQITLPNSPTLSARVAGTSTTQSVTLTAAGCPAGSTVRWTSGSSTATGAIWIRPFTQNTTYSALCEAATGCRSNPATLPLTYTVPPTPTVVVNGPTLLCAGESTTLTASNCPADQTVRWSSGQTGAILVLTPTATAYYTAACVSGEVISEPSLQVQISVSNSLTVTGRTTYSLGETISLTATSSAPGSVSYTWNDANGSVYIGANLSILGASSTQSGSYTVVAKASQGCAGRMTVVISVTGISTLPLNQSATCAGSTLPVSFSAGSYSNSNLFYVQLSAPGGSFATSTTIGSGTSSPITATLPTNLTPGNYLVRVISSYPYVEGTPSATTLTVSAPPSLTASNSSPSGQTTVGSSLTLTTTGQNLTGATYQWTGPGVDSPNTFTSTAANPTLPTTTTASNGIYTVVVTTPGGCTATAQTSVSLTPVSSCSLTFDGPLSVSCVSTTVVSGTTITTTSAGSLTVRLLNVPAGGTPTVSLYQQTTASTGSYVLSATATGATTSFTGLTDGTYRVEAVVVTNGVACSATLGGQTSATVVVRCNAEPFNIRIVPMDATPKETDKLPRVNGGYGTLKLSVEELEGQDLTGFTYLWTEPAGTTATSTTATTSTATSATLTATRIGEYKVTLTRGSEVLVAYVTISAMPCTERNATYSSCKTVTINDPNATNTLTNLAPGDIFYAGDYKVEVTQASSSGNGWTGEGTVHVTLINGFALPAQVTFMDIKLNDCYELTGGAVITKYDPTWSNVVDTGGIIGLFDAIEQTYKDLQEFLKTYDGSPEQKAKLTEYQAKLETYKGDLNQSDDILPATKAFYVDILNNSETILQCPLSQTVGARSIPTGNARVATDNTCSLEDTQTQISQQQALLGQFVWVAIPKNTSANQSFLECIASIDYRELNAVPSGSQSITLILTRDGKEVDRIKATIRGSFYRILYNGVEFYHAKKPSYCNGKPITLIHRYGNDNSYDGMYYYYDFDQSKYIPFLPKNYPRESVNQMITRMSPGLIKFADVTQEVMTNTALLLATGGLGGGVISRSVGVLDYLITNYQSIQEVTNPDQATALSTASAALFLFQLIDIDKLLKDPTHLPEDVRKLAAKAKELEESGELADKLQDLLEYVQQKLDKDNSVRKYVEEVVAKHTGRIVNVSDELIQALIKYRRYGLGSKDYDNIVTALLNNPNGYYLAQSIIKYTKLTLDDPQRLKGLWEIVSATKQLNKASELAKAEGYLVQTFQEADALIARGKDVFFEVKNFDANGKKIGDADLLIKSATGIIEEAYQLKSLPIANDFDGINKELRKAIGQFGQIQTTNRSVKIWSRALSESEGAAIIAQLRMTYANAPEKIFVKFKDSANYILIN